MKRVALLTEGVDRNILTYIQYVDGPVVALLTEGVDRNTLSRQAFINDDIVALLTEGVDRNSVAEAISYIAQRSPSSRRAWIEMIRQWQTPQPSAGRPPHGGRG